VEQRLPIRFTQKNEFLPTNLPFQNTSVFKTLIYQMPSANKEKKTKQNKTNKKQTKKQTNKQKNERKKRKNNKNKK